MLGVLVTALIIALTMNTWGVENKELPQVLISGMFFYPL